MKLVKMSGLMPGKNRLVIVAIVTFVSTLQQSLISGYGCQTSLPQSVEPNQACYKRRAADLARRRAIFSLTEPSERFRFPRLNMTIDQYRNFLKTEPFWQLHTQLQSGLFQAAANTYYAYLTKTKNLSNIPQMTEYQEITEFFGKFATKQFGHYMRKVSDFELFQNDSSSWITDDLFAEQRLAGNNPMALQQVTLTGDRGMSWIELKKTLNPNFDWGGAFQQTTCGCGANGKKKGENPFKKAIEDGHIFVLRHSICDNIPSPKKDLAEPPGPHPPRDLWELKSPIALFKSVKDPKSNNRRLKPFAIQMDYKPDSKVYTPQDSCAWTLAKLNVQLTDLLHAQVIEHLSKVHFIAEILCVSLERYLSRYHPIYIIMRFHCRGTITSNTFGAPTLVYPKGAVDQLFPIGWQGSILLINRAAEISNWDDLDLEYDLKKRGVFDKKLLTYYPYRDDGLVILDAIKDMVKDYIDAYYKTDDHVSGDDELQSFVNGVSRDGTGKDGGAGNVKGFPAKVLTKEALIKMFSRIIWVMSAQHAAVNFPLSDYSLYTPNAPTKLYNDSRGNGNPFTIYNLPYRATAAHQQRTFIGLGLLRLDRLFDYGPLLLDKRGREVLYKHFQIMLNKVEPILDKRNKKRFKEGHLTYPYFLPRWLPNGVQT